jgi:ATP-binding cassette subfamily A (ABC1) protein 3
MLLMYMTAYMQTNVNAPPDKVPSQLLLIHFTLGIITPIGQLTRALIVGMNLFSTLCVGLPPTKATNPGAIKLYGGPIVYLIGQSLFLFGILVWHDHGFSFPFKRKDNQQEYNLEDTTTHEPEVSEEIARASRENDGLRVLHISKSFRTFTYGKVNAIEDLTFGVKPGEVFALVGPNGGTSLPFSLPPLLIPIPYHPIPSHTVHISHLMHTQTMTWSSPSHRISQSASPSSHSPLPDHRVPTTPALLGG